MNTLYVTHHAKIFNQGGGNQGKVTIQGDPLFQRFLAK